MIENKFYFISYTFIGKNIWHDVINMKPHEWIEYVESKYKFNQFKLIKWEEITEEEYDSLKTYYHFYHQQPIDYHSGVSIQNN
jgi:hypothetical protein